MEPFVAGLYVYPIKALDGARVRRVSIVGRGALAHDREFGIVDARGSWVNGKREPLVHALRVTYDDPRPTRAAFHSERTGSRFSFDFEDAPHGLEAWLGEHFSYPVRLRRDDRGGFSDDTRAPGPTIVSTATLEAVASWFPELDVANVRRRLRANVEIGGVPAFWEDGLFGPAGGANPFSIGDVVLVGTNPCARCVVPSRDPATGETLASFAKIIAERRAATLPAWADRSRFDHFYRLTTNTTVAETEVGKSLELADSVRTEP